MFDRLLVLNSSISGEASVSAGIVEEIVRQVTRHHPGLAIVRSELGVHPIPHLTAASVAGVRGEPVTADERAARVLSDELISELKAADVIVIGAPMYNFSIPSTLRTWFDHVLRAGVTFSYSKNGPEGLLKDKQVIVIESRGGLYSEGPGQVADFQEPYLRYLLGFMGLTNVTFIRAEKIGYGTQARDEAIRSALLEVERLVSPLKAAA